MSEHVSQKNDVDDILKKGAGKAGQRLPGKLLTIHHYKENKTHAR